MLLTKFVKIIQQLEFFEVFLLFSVKKLFLSKAFSMTEMKIY